MSESDPITVRYAAGDADVIAIHRFLVAIAGPRLPAPIDGPKSAVEVWRVVNAEAALIAERAGELVGTLGIIRPDWWWSETAFFANRWFFCRPGSGAWRPLLREARALAVAVGLELLIISEERGKVIIINRSPRRPKRASAGANDEA